MKAWPVLAILLAGCFSGKSIEGEAGASGEAVEASLLTFRVDGTAGAPSEPDEPEVSEDDPVDGPMDEPRDAGPPRPPARADGGDGDGGTQSECPAGFVCQHVESLLGSDVCVIDGEPLPSLCADGGCDAYPGAACIGFPAGEYCAQSCVL